MMKCRHCHKSVNFFTAFLSILKCGKVYCAMCDAKVSNGIIFKR